MSQRFTPIPAVQPVSTVHRSALGIPQRSRFAPAVQHRCVPGSPWIQAHPCLPGLPMRPRPTPAVLVRITAPIACHHPPLMSSPLPTAHCPLPTAHCPLPTARARCPLRCAVHGQLRHCCPARCPTFTSVARRPSPVARMPDAGCPLRNRRCPWCISLLSLLVPLVPRRSAEPLLEHRTPESPSGLAPPPHANNDRSARRTPPLVAPPKLWRGRAVPSSQSLVSWCPSPLKPCTCSICRRDCGSCVATRFGRCLGWFSAAGRHRSGWNSR